MLASYHTHTYRCKHATGTEEEYILKAIAEGIKILGFSDHAPMPYKNGYVSYYKMHPDELGDYFSTLLSLKDKYKDQIDIKIGLETEFYESIWEDCLDFWSSYPVDYLILGQHFVPEEIRGTDMYSGFPSADKERLRLYTDTVIKAIRTGKISCIAHPDLLNYCGIDTDFYLDECQRLIKEAVRLDIPIEFNLLGLKAERNYPNIPFWAIAEECGAMTIIGCDSHAVSQVANPDAIAAGREILLRMGITPIDEMELINPFQHT